MRRRTLLRTALLGTALSTISVSSLLTAAQKPSVLVLIELSGGNDSLNTVIPLEQIGTYLKLRPQLGLQNSERFTLDERFALHKAMKPLAHAWKDGDLAIVHGLGYPNPNRSHFRSIEIWDTASDASEYISDGWLTTAAQTLSTATLDALVFGRNSSPVNGRGNRTLRIDNIRQLTNLSHKINHRKTTESSTALEHLIKLQSIISESHKELAPTLKKSPNPETEFPQTRFGQHLSAVARIIRLNLGIPVFKVAIDGFDTHRNQHPSHARLLKDLAEGLQAFRTEMIAAGLWNRVAVLTYSEFGRRAKQNGSGGSDHGTAASHFVLGGSVNGGHIGMHPTLSDLKNQDMQFTTDFRQLYQTVLHQWWKHPELTVAGRSWETLPLFRAT